MGRDEPLLCTEREVDLKTTQAMSKAEIDAASIARDLGSQKVSNIVMLGAASDYLGLTQESLEGALNTLFRRKGEEVVALNIQALKAGKNGVKI